MIKAANQPCSFDILILEKNLQFGSAFADINSTDFDLFNIQSCMG
jgi:hypothetical protein